ncbi:MAG: TIM-barrel domain-containing protein [Verrucomicrobiota bacterium]
MEPPTSQKHFGASSHKQAVYPGVWKVCLGGTPEAFTPISVRAVPVQEERLGELPALESPPFDLAAIRVRKQARGLLVELPLGGEEIYGFGLQLKSFRQSGKKKTIRVNSDPASDTGDSHAPVPFYVTTSGYGVLVDTARYASFYVGSHQAPEGSASHAGLPATFSSTNTEALYAGGAKASQHVAVDIPHVEGVDVYIFGGPTMLDAVRRYALFSGGGALPPMWGLGIWYRTYGRFNQEEVLTLARDLREAKIPCDVLGLEPGWHSHAYSCSYRWNPESFPAPASMISELRDLRFQINLWEHAFIHPSSPLYHELQSFSGSRAVWNGLIPDFSLPEAREIFAAYHEKIFIREGISGFKLDECDNSDFISYPWSFPEHTEFPGGMDGEQMHSLFGTLYARALWQAFRNNNLRTLGQVRSGHALSAPLPFVLYSDLYDQSDFLRGVVNAGFCGLLWSPEVRQCMSVEDLLRRLQMVVFSPQALVNAWMVPLPPWRQFDEVKNRAGELHADWREIEVEVRDLFEFRMRLIPYLYSAFAEYHFSGIPVCRALVLDYPQDPETYNIDDQYLLGPSLLVAPMLAGQTSRRVYLPEGKWVSFADNKLFAGNQWIDAGLHTMPLFVKYNTLLPLADPMQAIGHDPAFSITVKVFGDDAVEPFRLYADDGVSFDYENGRCSWLELGWHPQRGGTSTMTNQAFPGRYLIRKWESVPVA